MIRFFLFFISTLIFSAVALAQGPQVPSQMDFAGMKLKLTDAARRDIQSDVDALHRSRKYLDMKLERVNMYFPIIERIFREEGLPDDFKYLVIQESALISDAVSTSNAVGFWQFKKESAQEVGMQITGSIDERMNIVSATRGAANYLKRNNFYFDNWLYALLSYLQGRGGTEKTVDKRYYGSKRYTIDKREHWYIKKYLAHKIAFENEVYAAAPPYTLVEYTRGTGKSLKDISKELDIPLELIEEYNKWLKKGRIPDDKIYTVILPMKGKPSREILAQASGKPSKPATTAFEYHKEEDQSVYPVLKDWNGQVGTTQLVDVNGRPGIIAGNNATIGTLATMGGRSEKKFRKQNDLPGNARAVDGQVYYLRNKRNKGPVHYHTVQPGETLWSISQKYGIKMNSLLRKNRMREIETVRPGRVLWLRHIRPSDEPVQYREVKPAAAPTSAPTVSPEVTTPEVNTTLAENNLDRQENKPNANSSQDTTRRPMEIIRNTDRDTLYKAAPDTSVLQESTKLSNETEEREEGFEPPENVKLLEYEGNGEEKNAEGIRIHTVRQGETLYSLSRYYNVPVDSLRTWNALPDNALKIGQKLLLEPYSPKKSENKKLDDISSPAKQLIHVVAPGETLYSIARKYGITMKELMEWNNKEDFNIRIGEQLKVNNPG